MLGRGSVFACALVLASPCAAIVSNPLPRVCNEFPHSDYVFSGKVLSDTYQWHEYFRGEPSEIYRIRVDHVFKGQVPSIVRLYTSVDSGRGTLIARQEAIVFAKRQEGRIAFDGSSNSQSGRGVPAVVAAVRSYLAHPPRVATIAGRIDGWMLSAVKHSTGARLLLTDGTTRKFVDADEHGKFMASVTPGRWSVRIAEPGWASRTGVYSYDSAEGTHLAKSGCADLQIETARPGEKLDGPLWKRWPK